MLRGPQGTLFGKNTTGGAISLSTAKPGPVFDSYVTLRAADFNETGIRGMVNVPITSGFVSLDVGVLDSNYANFTYTDIISGEVTTVAETQIQNRRPDWTVTASVEHAFQLANGATLTPQLGVYLQDDYEHWPPRRRRFFGFAVLPSFAIG